LAVAQSDIFMALSFIFTRKDRLVRLGIGRLAILGLVFLEAIWEHTSG